MFIWLGSMALTRMTREKWGRENSKQMFNLSKIGVFAKQLQFHFKFLTHLPPPPE